MSTVKANAWLNLDGTENYKCRAWVNFNGTGTVAIRAAGNVTSITDNGVGYYTVNFATALPDANYSVQGVAQRPGGTNSAVVTIRDALNLTTTACPVSVVSQTGATSTDADSTIVCVAVFR